MRAASQYISLYNKIVQSAHHLHKSKHENILTDKVASRSKLSIRVEDFFKFNFSGLPWEIIINDWTGATYSVGQKQVHWANQPLIITIKTESAGKKLVSYNIMGFLEKFLAGEVDLEGNLYFINDIQKHAKLRLKFHQLLYNLLFHFAFQNISRAKVSVKSHYDIPQEALNIYLDQVYMSYSCGMFENPDNLDLQEILRVGRGEADDFDSLEKAQWRKFKDAIDYINPKEGDTLLDIGCGYGGQLIVALENYDFKKIVGWTHSTNQEQEGSKMLAKFDTNRWELHEGDYREDNRIFDHITSTGMVSHVGPKGLIPYVKNVRKRIKTGGRYLHHSLMNTAKSHTSYGSNIGLMFNKKYVWPGFHWFTIAEHVKALENNGFEVQRMTNLSRHYAKTTAAWYERMMSHKEIMIKNLGEPTFRAWQIFLAGITGAYLNHGVHVYRLYCQAI